MTITTFDKLSPQDQSLVRLAMQYRDNAYTPYSHHQVGASVRTASGTCYGGCNVEVISLQTTLLHLLEQYDEPLQLQK